jgi:hypothetical protein
MTEILTFEEWKKEHFQISNDLSSIEKSLDAEYGVQLEAELEIIARNCYNDYIKELS